MKLHAHLLIFVTVLLDMMSMSVASPVMPRLMAELSGGDAAEVARLFGAYGTLFFAVQIFAAPLQGALSDRFGRRPVILASNFGMAASFVVLALAPDLTWLFIARAIAGFASGSITVAYAYMIDITPAERRTRMFSFLGSAMSVGAMSGLMLGGVAGSADPRLPFWIAFGFSVANGLFALFILPESLDAVHRAPHLSFARANPLGLMRSLTRSYPILIWWFIALLIGDIANTGIGWTFQVYTTYRYDWSPRDLGIYLTGLSLWSLAVQAAVVPWLTKRMSDRRSFLIGSLIEVVFLAACGLAFNGPLYWVFAFTYLLGTHLSNVALTTLLSRAVGPSDQGGAQGAASALRSLAGLVGPGVFALMLASSITAGGKPLSGIIFPVAGLFLAISAVILMRITRGSTS